MAIIIYNPTNEEFTATYIGISDKILPEQKLRVDDARGRAYLNELGKRGLVQLEYGDEGEGAKRKADAGRNKNLEFKRKNVLRYNQTNERAKMNGAAYNDPPQQIKEYAEELGLSLIQPFQFTDEKNIRMADLKQESLSKDRLLAEKDREMGELKDSMKTMQEQMSAMMAMFQGQKAAAPAKSPEAVAVDIVEIRKKLGFKSLNSNQYERWVHRNWQEIFTQPDEIQREIKMKYADLYARPFPDERPELDLAAG